MAQEDIEQLKATLKLKERLPESLYPLLDRRDGATEFARELPKNFDPTSIMDGLPGQDTWTSVAAFYRAQGRTHEALLIYYALYDHMLVAEEQTRKRFHKGTPLVYLSDCYTSLGYVLIARRYLILTLVKTLFESSGKSHQTRQEFTSGLCGEVGYLIRN